MAALSQTPANVIAVAGSITVRGTSGATITAGMPVYRDSAAANVYKACKANAAGTANCDGIALCGASSGQPIIVCTSGQLNLGGTLTVGATYAVSAAAAGAIVINAAADLGSGTYVTNLGVATTASNMILQILNSGTAKA